MGFNIERVNKPFVVKSPYKPSGDQPRAIEELATRIENGENDVVLMGATGTGKTATTAWLIERLQRPTLIIEPNKTLAAQLCAEFRELMPDNAVSYFVSYYDYYQPEAYIPQTDTYIEKDSNINDDVERLRHAATANLLTRRDCVVVATVSCIYGLGTPEEYAGRMLLLKEGQQIDRDDLLRKFVAMQYKRNDIAFTRGTFRVRGDTVEIIPVYEELAIRIEFFGDEIDRISTLHPLTGDVIGHEEQVHIFPASHYVAGPERMERALKTIQQELDERTAELRKQGKELEAQRLTMRTTYDLEMLSQVGVCSGVENYSRHFDGRAPGTPPHTLLDFFPDDFLLVIDESHVTVPQIGAMYEGDASRKRTLVEHGFRLPSAMDNRPLKWPEFQKRVGQTVYLSATPGDYELGRSNGVVEQIIRPTGLVDPQIDVRPVEGQVDDLLAEIKDRVARNERALVTTLTKKMAEDLTDYLETAASRSSICIPTWTRCGESNCCANSVKAKSTSSSASTCCARALICRKCRWWRFSTRTRRVSCVRIAPSSRPSDVPREMCPEPSSCMRMTSPTPCIRPSMRPTAAVTSKSPTTRNIASIRNLLSKRSPMSTTCLPRRMSTPRRCSAQDIGMRTRPATRISVFRPPARRKRTGGTRRSSRPVFRRRI